MNDMTFDFIPYNTFISEQNANSSEIKLKVPFFIIVLWIIISIVAAVISGACGQICLFGMSITQLCAILGFLFAFPKGGFSFEKHFALLGLGITSTISTVLLLLKMLDTPFVNNLSIGGIFSFIFVATIICLPIQYLYGNFRKKLHCTVEVISTVVGFMADYDIERGIYNYTPIYEYYYNGEKYQMHNNDYADVTMNCNKAETAQNMVIERNPKHPWEQKYCKKSIKILPVKLKALNDKVILMINPNDPYDCYIKK